MNLRINYRSLRELLREDESISTLDVLHALTDQIRAEDADDISLQYLESAKVAYVNDRPDTKLATRTIEYWRMWEGQQWDTDFIEIPYDTDEDDIGLAVQTAANDIDWKDEIPVFVGVYHIPEDEE